MERKGIIVSSVVGFLGLLSAALGFAAEATRIKRSEVKFLSQDVCIYPRSHALGLGLSAAISLMVAQVTINVATGCMCCCRRGQAHSNWKLALICFIVSWFMSVIAFLLLLSRAALNDEHNEDFSYYYCNVVKPGVFAGAAVLSLASVVLGLVYYYIIITSAKNNGINNNPSNAGIVMGQPQFPP